MHLWPVEHFFPHFLVPVVLEVPQVASYKIHTLEYIREGKSLLS